MESNKEKSSIAIAPKIILHFGAPIIFWSTIDRDLYNLILKDVSINTILNIALCSKNRMFGTKVSYSNTIKYKKSTHKQLFRS